MQSTKYELHTELKDQPPYYNTYKTQYYYIGYHKIWGWMRLGHGDTPELAMEASKKFVESNSEMERKCNLDERYSKIIKQ